MKILQVNYLKKDDIMRKLASIQKIKKIDVIPGADRVELAHVLGWTSIIQKDSFKEGENIIFMEIDSVLPEKPEFEFMRRTRFRVKTMKSPRLKVISQGLIFDMSILPEGDYNVDDDVTDILEIKKYEIEIPLTMRGTIKGNFPEFIPKTDETRVQVLSNMLKRHAGTMCYVTEKIDGTSFTAYYKDGKFGVCSRNRELKETDDNVYWKFANELKLKEKMESYGKNICLQGELVGQKLNKNPLKLVGNDLYFFNVIDIDTYTYLDFEPFVKLISDFKLKTVPILSRMYKLESDVEVHLEKAKAMSVITPDVQREGVVIRPLVEMHDMEISQGFANGRLSFKAVNNDYLLKHE